MSVSIIDDGTHAVMYCDTTMRAFGPVFYSGEGEEVIEFLEWLEQDPRFLGAIELPGLVDRWRGERKREAH